MGIHLEGLLSGLFWHVRCSYVIYERDDSHSRFSERYLGDSLRSSDGRPVTSGRQRELPVDFVTGYLSQPATVTFRVFTNPDDTMSLTADVVGYG